jgi:hypothetical protein
MTRASEGAVRSLFVLALFLGAACMSKPPAASTVPAPAPASTPDPTRAVLLVHVDGVDVDWTEPWGAGKAWSRTIIGLPAPGHRVLVAGWHLRNAQHAEVQKPGAVGRAAARIERFDVDAGLAVLAVDDPAFWADIGPAPLSRTLPHPGRVKVVHALPDGLRAESFDAVAIGYDARGTFPFLELKLEQIESQHVAIADAVSVDGEFVGIVTITGSDVLAVTSVTLADFLDLASHPPYRGYAWSGFSWQRLSNPVLRQSLGLGPSDGGVLVRRVWPRGSAFGVLDEGDVVLAVGDQAIDNDGTYAHPIAKRMQLQTLFSNGPHPGDTVSLQIRRHGERKTVNLVLKSWSDDETLVPWFGDRHAYLVRGGLVFERLSHEYLLAIGKDFEQKAPPALLEPFELNRYESTIERPGIVVLTRALPVPATLGYEHVRNLAVDRINDAPVHTIEEVREAFAHPIGGFHIVTFSDGQGLQRIVLDAEEAKAADATLRQKYRLEEASATGAR